MPLLSLVQTTLRALARDLHMARKAVETADTLLATYDRDDLTAGELQAQIADLQWKLREHRDKDVRRKKLEADLKSATEVKASAEEALRTAVASEKELATDAKASEFPGVKAFTEKVEVELDDERAALDAVCNGLRYVKGLLRIDLKVLANLHQEGFIESADWYSEVTKYVPSIKSDLSEYATADTAAEVDPIPF